MNGLQRQVGPLCSKTGRRIDRFKTVVGTLEEGLHRFQPEHDPYVITSSRTDKGVHAVCNTVHVDLKPGPSKAYKEYDPAVLCMGLNNYFLKTGEAIRILKVRRVPNNFHARFSAKSRRYLYRIGVCQEPTDHPIYLTQPYSVFENDRITMVKPPLDIDKMKQGAEMLSGRKNYLAFTCPGFLEKWQNPVKTLHISIEPGRMWVDNSSSLIQEKFTCYDIIVTGSSFLYHMVRKLVACLLSIGRGRLALSDVQDLFDNPHQYWNNPLLGSAQPYALYLLDVHYDEKDLIFEPMERYKYDRAILGLSKTLDARVEQNSPGISDLTENTSIDRTCVEYLHTVKSR